MRQRIPITHRTYGLILLKNFLIYTQVKWKWKLYLLSDIYKAHFSSVTFWLKQLWVPLWSTLKKISNFQRPVCEWNTKHHNCNLIFSKKRIILLLLLFMLLGSYAFFFFLKIYLLIDWLLCWVFVSVLGPSLVAASGGHSSSWCAGLSPLWPLVVEHRLQTRRLSSCGSRAQLLRGMWDLPRPGLEPVSPALAGRFSTTAPPGKPGSYAFK